MVFASVSSFTLSFALFLLFFTFFLLWRPHQTGPPGLAPKFIEDPQRGKKRTNFSAGEGKKNTLRVPTGPHWVSPLACMKKTKQKKTKKNPNNQFQTSQTLTLNKVSFGQSRSDNDGQPVWPKSVFDPRMQQEQWWTEKGKNIRNGSESILETR